MRSSRWCIGLACLAGWIGLAGCSKEGEPAGGEGQAAARGETPLRVYAALPPELLRGAADPASIRSMTAIELALSANDLDGALPKYQQIVQEPACGPRTRALLTGRLVEVCLRLQRVPEAAALIAQVTPDAPSLPVALRDHLSWLRAVVQLSQACGSLAEGADAWEARRREVLASLAAGSGPCPWPACLDALARAIPGAVEAGPAAIDRLERLMMDVQVAVAVPDLLVPLQRQRVELLAKAERRADLLHEARILLALSVTSVTSWAQNVTWVEQQIRQAGDAPLAGRVAAFARSGTQGPDGEAGTADDLVDPLAQATRQIAALQGSAGRAAGEEPLSDAYALLLAGRGADAAAYVERLRQKVRPIDDAQATAILQAVMMAVALRDGHGLACEEGLRSLAAPAAARADEGEWLWAHLAQRLLQQRAEERASLAKTDAMGLAVAAYRQVIDADSAGGVEELGIVFAACKVLCEDKTLPAQQERFRQFRVGLQGRPAQVAAAKLAAEQWLAAANIAAALAELETIAPAEAAADSEVQLLRAGCLIGQGKPADAAACVEAAMKSADLTCDRLARAYMIQGAILVQQGKVIEAREALDRVGDLAADARYKARAKGMLDKI